MMCEVRVKNELVTPCQINWSYQPLYIGEFAVKCKLLAPTTNLIFFYHFYLASLADIFYLVVVQLMQEGSL